MTSKTVLRRAGLPLAVVLLAALVGCAGTPGQSPAQPTLGKPPR